MESSLPPEISSQSGWATSATTTTTHTDNNINISGQTTTTTTATSSNNNSNNNLTGLEGGLSGMKLSSNSNKNNMTSSSGDSVHSQHSAGSYGAIGGGLTAGSGFGGNSSVAGNSVGSAPATFSRPPGLAHINISHVTTTTNTTTAGNSNSTQQQPGHTKNSSTSSSSAHTATLTPTSSLDGGVSTDLYGLNTSRQSGVHSPVNSSVASAADHLPGITGLGSFDAADDDRSHDGLLGLQALRDRSHSSPGPVLSSSPMGGANNSFSSSPRAIGVPPARPRAVSKDNGRGISGPSGSSRPPLAGGSALSPSAAAVNAADFGGANNTGIISRPPEQPSFSQYAADGGFDSSLRRGLSDAGSEYSRGNGGGSGADGFISDNKFTANPFSSSPGQSRNVSNFASGGPSLPPALQRGPEVYHQRHQRSQSQPGPRMPTTDYYGNNIPAHGDYSGSSGNTRRGNDYGGGGYQGDQYDDSGYGSHGGSSLPGYPRSMSMQHSNNAYSDPNFHENNHHRRGSTGYYGSRKYDHQHDRMGNSNYPRQDRMISPSSYGGHSRQSSDMGNSTLTSSPMSLSSGPMYNQNREFGTADDDLAHPLAGESIDVPGEEQYFGGTNAHLPHARAHSIGHGPGPSYHGDSRRLPTAGAGLPPFRAVYNVKFKRTQRPFEIGPRLSRDLKVGTYVKVEADRGEDLGIVVGFVGKGLSVPHRASFGGGMGDAPVPPNSQLPHDRKKIIRLATHDEVALLQMKREEEDELLRVCRMKARQRGLLMNVVDAEYQFDRHKLTFFFEAEGRVDFRDLVRDLFSIYKTRIWMQQLDKSISATCPAAPEPEPTGIDYGTPIIAPAHEYEEYAPGNSGPPNLDDGFTSAHQE
eukprot:CAMPEP_0113508924 /NCGR_PEP_ID=MMETSP0014_2-20120614/37283_1 /TAXON_ID=2857 /ORGANISM="Nitzschia sp." /LENGTH=865 /DNA_ID=CAMNT_0000404683 /DNA_START=217 /DNA_END=2814 /DNA_ORIENTATION=+ /assembly_acc=CAM_ASM_000159